MSGDPKQIIILGGGFAGVYTARYLEKLLRPEEASITLINRENYWVYQPMLPEIILGSIGLTNVVSPIRRLCRRTNLIMREVRDINLKDQIVTISPGFRPRHLRLKYDYLVIALGSITNFHGMPGMMENAMPFRTLADAMVLRNHLIHVLEEADVEGNPELRRQLLTFVVGGGGFSGIEVMAELNDFVRSVKKNYLRLRDEPHRCVIVQAGDRGIRKQHSEPGDIIFQQGDLGDSVYVIEEGQCEALREHNGKQELLASLDRGAYFEEMALLSNRTRNATIRACTAMDVLIIPKIDFDKLRQSVPAFGTYLTSWQSSVG
jgi:CRP-like cAMP-binding protein